MINPAALLPGAVSTRPNAEDRSPFQVPVTSPVSTPAEAQASKHAGEGVSFDSPAQVTTLQSTHKVCFRFRLSSYPVVLNLFGVLNPLHLFFKWTLRTPQHLPNCGLEGQLVRNSGNCILNAFKFMHVCKVYRALLVWNYIYASSNSNKTARSRFCPKQTAFLKIYIEPFLCVKSFFPPSSSFFSAYQLHHLFATLSI